MKFNEKPSLKNDVRADETNDIKKFAELFTLLIEIDQTEKRKEAKEHERKN